MRALITKGAKNTDSLMGFMAAATAKAWIGGEEGVKAAALSSSLHPMRLPSTEPDSAASDKLVLHLAEVKPVFGGDWEKQRKEHHSSSLQVCRPGDSCPQLDPKHSKGGILLKLN